MHIYHIHIMSSFSLYHRYKLNSHLACFPQGFIAQLIEHHTGITEVMGLNPVEASEFFLGFICNCLSYFITARITFSCILYPQFTHDLYSIHIVNFHLAINCLYNLSCLPFAPLPLN